MAFPQVPTAHPSMGSSSRELPRVPCGVHSLVLFRVPAPGGHPGVLGLHGGSGGMLTRLFPQETHAVHTEGGRAAHAHQPLSGVHEEDLARSTRVPHGATLLAWTPQPCTSPSHPKKPSSALEGPPH